MHCRVGSSPFLSGFFCSVMHLVILSFAVCCPVLQAGFGHDYESVLQDVPPRDHLLRVLPRCFTEVMLRLANPFRALAPRLYKTGAKGQCEAVCICMFRWSGVRQGSSRAQLQ